MKKLLGIVVLGLLLSGNVYAADYEKFFIKKKDGSENLYYNLLIEDYNKYIKDTYTDGSCGNLPRSSSYLLDYMDCNYRDIKRLMKRNRISSNQRIIDAEHEFYINLRSRAKTLSKKWIINGTDSRPSQEIKVFFNYFDSLAEKTNFYTRDIWINYAVNEQIEYKKRKTKKVEKSSNTLVLDLKELKDLLDSGALTRDQYEKAKEKLLN